MAMSSSRPSENVKKFWVFEYRLSVFILTVQTEYLEKVGTARED